MDNCFRKCFAELSVYQEGFVAYFEFFTRVFEILKT